MSGHGDRTELLDAISPGSEYPANCTSSGTAAANSIIYFLLEKAS